MYLDWETSDRDYYVLDIETDALDATKIWVLCWENVKTGEAGYETTTDGIRRLIERGKDAVWIGHNIISFDAPAVFKLTGAHIPIDSVIDTLLLSKLYDPNLRGGHSLENWGNILKFPKSEHKDFSVFSPEMLEYCQRDVSLTVRLYKKIAAVLSRYRFTEQSCYIQHHFWDVLRRQKDRGFYFNIPQAIDLFEDLRKKERELGNEIKVAFPPTRTKIGEGEIFRRDGEETFRYQKYRDDPSFIVEVSGGRFTVFKDIEFNIGSPKQRVEKLLELGWIPEEFTEKGFPKATEESLESFAEASGIKEIGLIHEWLAINGRANMIGNWIDHVDFNDSRIHGTLDVASTLRLRHSAPNSGNIPGVRVKDGKILRGKEGLYTYEARDCWQATPGRVLVGIDAKSLELCMLAHFLNRADFTREILEGDPHQRNADLTGLSRSTAKTLLYAIQYGARPKKVASIVGVSVRQGASIRKEFLDKLGLTDLIDECERLQQGRIPLIDGSQILCPSPHAALNYRLQGSGARVMALGAILLDQKIRKEGLDAWKVGDIHDEWQWDCHPRDADRVCELGLASLTEAGEILKLNIPISGTAKIGKTWAETH